MRVLILVNNFPDVDDKNTANIFVKEQVRALSKFVEKIDVIVPYPWGMECKRKRKYENYSFDNVNVYFLKYFNPIFPLAWRFWQREWIKVETNAILDFIKNKKMKPDIIHAHYTWPCGAVAVMIKKILNIPVVITEHSHTSLYPKLQKKDKIILGTWKNADVVIRVNQKDIPWFRQLVPETTFISIPNGYNPIRLKHVSKEYAKKKLHIPENRKILFNLARLFPYKGHKYLIDAIKILLEKRDDILCLIGGEGPLKKELLRQISSLGIENHVKLLGFIPDNEIHLWMNAADIFVLPSLNEGNPTVMFEALGVGLPFVGTTVGGVPEIITSEDYGLLCPPADPECLAEKILIALEKDWDREKIIKYAQQFTWENIAKEILRVYEKVIKMT